MPDTKDGECIIEMESKIWDLTATMQAEIVETSDAHGPVSIIHENQDFEIRAKVSLKGRILHYLCGKLCVEVGFESCGAGFEGDYFQDVELVPCGDGVYNFRIRVAGGTLSAGHCGKAFTICLTLGSFDACGHPGFVFGRCHDLSVTIVPAVVH